MWPFSNSKQVAALKEQILSQNASINALSNDLEESENFNLRIAAENAELKHALAEKARVLDELSNIVIDLKARNLELELAKAALAPTKPSKKKGKKRV